MFVNFRGELQAETPQEVLIGSQQFIAMNLGPGNLYVSANADANTSDEVEVLSLLIPPNTALPFYYGYRLPRISIVSDDAAYVQIHTIR